VAEQVRDQEPRLFRRQRLQLDRPRCRPVQAPLEELGTGDAAQDERSPPAFAGDVLDEVAEDGLRPLQVVEDDHQGLLVGQALEQASSRQEDFGRARLAAEANRRRHAVDDSIGVGRVGEELAESFAGLGRGLVAAEAGRVPHDLDERPVRDSIAVRQAAAGEEAGMRSPHREFADEARFADPGRSQEHHEPRLRERLGLRQRGAELGEFPGASDEG